MTICGMKPMTAPAPETMPSLTRDCSHGATSAASMASAMIAPRPGIHRPHVPSDGSGSSTSSAFW